MKIGCGTARPTTYFTFPLKIQMILEASRIAFQERIGLLT